MLVGVLLETIKIIFIVFVLMAVIEFLELKYKNRIRKALTKKPLRQYLISSALGSVPGCIDAFFIVSLFISGIVSFGALVSVMIATAGDEAFIMLAMIPETALLIFAVCFVLGVIGGFLSDKFVKKFKIKLSKKCYIEIHDKDKKIDFNHFVKEHLYGHIIKKHILKLFLWLFFSMLVIEFFTTNFDIQAILPQNKLLLILFAALVGMIPESGPHLVFVILFSKGLVPFSVLLTSSISQDGHGLLPLLSHSLRDTAWVQIFTTMFALFAGLIFFLMGV